MEQPINMQQIMKLARSPAGQKLLEAMRKSGTDMEKAATYAQNGNMEQAKNAISGLLDDPQVRSLLRQLEGHL